MASVSAVPLPVADSTEAAAAQFFGPEVVGLDRTLWHLLSSSATSFSEREAVVSLWQSADSARRQPREGQHAAAGCLRWSYRALHQKAIRLAEVLVGLGCEKGMPLAAVLLNSAEWALFFWAAAKIGMPFVPIDARAEADVDPMLAAVSPHLLVVQNADMAARLSFRKNQLQAPRILIQCSMAAADAHWLTLDSLLESSIVSQELDPPASKLPNSATGNTSSHDTALVIFTSGTTGSPKGCPHTSRNILAQTNDYDPNPDPIDIDRWLVHTPVSHIFAINNALRAWRYGGALIFPSGLFDVDCTLQALTSEKCTVMSATPTLVRTLLEHPRFPNRSEIDLSVVTIAGTSISLGDIRLCRQGLGARNAIQAYGMSEGGPLVSWSRRDPMLADGYHPGVGKVLPGAAVRICEPGGRRVLRCGEVGELHVGGPSVISGYLGGVESASFYDDEAASWMRTGDRARLDRDGVLHVLGRYKETIIRGGENIDPVRIEAALTQASGLQALVIGIPDPIAGQLVIAVVRLPDGVSKLQVSRNARALGPKYVLDGIYTLDELGLRGSMPTTSLGKPRRGLLRDVVVSYRSEQNPSSVRQGNRTRDLSRELARAWEEVSGDEPLPRHSFAYLADSISLLRYCDSVVRRTGCRLYLQDFAEHDTIEKQARLLCHRGSSLTSSRLDEKAINHPVGDESVSPFFGGNAAEPGTSPICKMARQCSDVEAQPADVDKRSLWIAARDHIKAVGLDRCRVEDVIRVRASLQRMITGQRPQSFHLRLVFRLRRASPEQVRAGLEKGLEVRPILRTIVCRPRGMAPFHAVVSPHRHLFSRQFRQLVIETEEEARQMWQDNGAETHSSDLMFRADLLSVRQTGHCYLVATYNHSVIDAIFLLQWHRDLCQLIDPAARPRISPTKSLYSHFADLFHQLQESPPAQGAVSFHAQRLRGIGRLRKAFWPRQRAPGWMVSHDGDSLHAETRRLVRVQVWRGTWSERALEFRFPRQSRVVRLGGLPELVRSHGLHPRVFSICALILFNVMQTTSPYAVFNSWESGRSWPFLPGWIQDRLPPAMSIDGPTVERVLQMTHIIPGETIAEFFARINREQEQVALHQHAPWDMVVSELKEEGGAALDASFRQSFVWDVSMGISQSRSWRDGDDSLESVARYDWADCGLCWNMFTISKDTIFFIVSWDAAQMNVEEVEGYCDTMADVMRRLADEASWDKPLGDTFHPLISLSESVSGIC